MSIHPTALVDSAAEIGAGVSIGPFCVIEAGVKIGDNCQIAAHAVIHGHTTLGPDNQVGVGAVLGGAPQDLKYHDEPSYVVIGARNIIREYVTVHRATGEGNTTVVGDENFLMAYTHVAHNCRLGNSIMMASYSGLSGFVTVEDFVVIGGLSGVHQYTTVGTMAMIAAMSRHSRDVPPYVIVEGSPARVRSLNLIGMKRRGVSPESISALRAAYKLLFDPQAELNVSAAIARVRAEVPMTPELSHLLGFLERIDEGSRGRQGG